MSDELAREVACPKCEAPPGERCVVESRNELIRVFWSHHARLKRAVDAGLVLGLSEVERRALRRMGIEINDE